jgi:photosystem II stability/assembly factor-like uncharacterized protein
MLDWQRARASVAACLLASMALSTVARGDSDPATAPKPAELMPDADKTLLLDVVNTGTHLVTVGSRGHILLSDDGEHWKQVEVPVRATLTAASFVDADNGWVVGHDTTILHTTDGGQTWAVQSFQPELEKPLLDVLFLDKQHGLAAGAYGLFQQTTDGGEHWAAINAPAILKDGLHLYAIRKLGNGHLLVAGEQGLVGLSADGGVNWTRLDTGYKGTFFGATAVGAAGAVVCGLRGNAYYTADVGAAAWQRIETGHNTSLFSCTTEGDSKVVMAGVNGVIDEVALPSLKVSRLKSPVDTPLSSIVPFKDGLIVAGEAGVHAVAAP